MTIAPERLRGATRWSMAARCPRMAAYGLLGVEPEPPTPREQGRFARGRDAGHYFARQMKAKHGEDNVIEEAAVPWPAPPELPVGELHVDVIVKSERLGIEAKNTKWVDSLFDSAVLQIAGGVHFSPDLDTGLVVFLDHEYQVTDEFPVFLTDELVEKVETIAAQVVEAGKTGTLPERVCEKPSDARSHLCPFAEHCFSDWAAPPPSEREDLSQLASEGWLIQRDLKAKKGCRSARAYRGDGRVHSGQADRREGPRDILPRQGAHCRRMGPRRRGALWPIHEDRRPVRAFRPHAHGGWWRGP